MATPPLKVAEVFNTAANADTNLVSTSFTPAGARSGVAAYRLTIALKTTDSVVEIQIIRGGVTVEADLNGGTALTAGKLYTFTFGASTSCTYNLHVETGTTIGYLLIEEIRDGVL
jgi:hypothetical protein